jgi:hypothetical protein
MALYFDKRQQVFVPTWNDNNQLPEPEQISCTYKTMTFKDVMQFQQENADKIPEDIQDNDTRPDVVLSLWEQINYILPHYTSDYKNVFDGEGNPLTTAEELLDAFGIKHLTLFIEIFNHVFKESGLGEQEAKNSNTDSEPDNSESAMTVEAA